MAVRQFNFVAVCYRIKDILMDAVVLSKYFQREDLDFSIALREIIVHTGPAEEEFFSSLQNNAFKGSKVFDCQTQKNSL